jgi:hypothetical protein
MTIMNLESGGALRAKHWIQSGSNSMFVIYESRKMPFVVSYKSLQIAFLLFVAVHSLEGAASMKQLLFCRMYLLCGLHSNLHFVCICEQQMEQGF